MGWPAALGFYRGGRGLGVKSRIQKALSADNHKVETGERKLSDKTSGG